ncbi:MAG: response regulator [Sedimentisphaerales bacterium]|jgi:two-component system alkaline phosphatase synthesis response regulator PhoP
MKKILIVDNEEDFLQMLDKRLTTEGYSVVKATNGTEAIGLALLQHPDIIILDVLMPDMEGEEVAAKLKEYSPTKNIPMIYLTALFSKADEEKIRSKTNGDMIFVKPLDADKLLEQIKKLLCSAAAL